MFSIWFITFYIIIENIYNLIYIKKKTQQVFPN